MKNHDRLIRIDSAKDFIVYNSKYEYSISLKDSFYLRAQEYGMNISERGYTEDSRNYYQDIVTNIINNVPTNITEQYTNVDNAPFIDCAIVSTSFVTIDNISPV